MKDLRYCTQHPKKAYKRTICVVKPTLYTEDGSQALGNVQPGMVHFMPYHSFPNLASHSVQHLYHYLGQMDRTR